MARTTHATADVIAFDQRPARIRLLLAHEDILLRAGLRALLERERDVSVVGEAACGDAAVALAGELEPDVIVMDTDLPGLPAPQAARRIVALLPGCRILMLGRGETDAELFAALRAGASGFVVKETDPAELVRAIRTVSRGDALLSPSVTRRLIDQFAAQPDPQLPAPERLEELTAREREVMGLVAMGLTNRDIAARLVVSPATAKTHVSRAMMKLHARDRAQLVTLAFQTGLVEPRPRLVAV